MFLRALIVDQYLVAVFRLVEYLHSLPGVVSSKNIFYLTLPRPSNKMVHGISKGESYLERSHRSHAPSPSIFFFMFKGTVLSHPDHARQTVGREDAQLVRSPPHWRHFSVTCTTRDQSAASYRSALFLYEDRRKDWKGNRANKPLMTKYTEKRHTSPLDFLRFPPLNTEYIYVCQLNCTIWTAVAGWLRPWPGHIE